MLRDLRLTGLAQGPDDEKLGQSFSWGASLGVSSLDLEGFRKENTFFSFGDVFDDPEGSPVLLTTSVAMLDDHDEHALSELALSLTLPLSIEYLLREASQEIGALRIKAYRRVIRQLWFKGFRRDLRLHSRLQLQKFLVERLSIERASNKANLFNWSGTINSFRAIKRPLVGLLDQFESRFDFVEKTVATHAELAARLFRLMLRLATWKLVIDCRDVSSGGRSL